MPLIYDLSDQLTYICEIIIDSFSPAIIISFGEKNDISTGELTDIDICVIGEFKDKKAAEKTAYHAIDSDIPFDLFFYDSEEWAVLSDEPGTFADRIKRRGRVVYEK